MLAAELAAVDWVQIIASVAALLQVALSLGRWVWKRLAKRKDVRGFFTAPRILSAIMLAVWVWLLYVDQFRVKTLLAGTVVLLFVAANVLEFRDSRAMKRPSIFTQPNKAADTPPPAKGPADAAPQSVPAGHKPDMKEETEKDRPGAEERIFVGAGVTPAYLFGLYEGRTDIQAQPMADTFVGKWMPISGPLMSVGAWHGTFSQVTVDLGDQRFRTVYMNFNDRSWVDRLEVLAPGDPITVHGRIRRISRVDIELANCELVGVG